MSQYDEEIIIRRFFETQEQGVVVEIGVGFFDINSNSLYLIEIGWNAFLVEPNKHFFEKLNQRYSLNPKVKLENVAAYYENLDEVDFFEYGQASTLNLEFKEKAVKAFVDKDGLPEKWMSCEGKEIRGFNETKVKAVKTSEIIEKYYKSIDFMSIDCEGADFDVIKGINFENINIKLICHEKQYEILGSKPNDSLNKEIETYLNKYNFEKIYENVGNIFYLNKNY